MGDRRCVAVKRGTGASVVLYTHWGGADLPQTVADALGSVGGRRRWQDPSYLARVIFSAMLRTDPHDDGETNFGIDAVENLDEVGLWDDHPLIVVDVTRQTVNGATFEDFIADPYQDED